MVTIVGSGMRNPYSSCLPATSGMVVSRSKAAAWCAYGWNHSGSDGNNSWAETPPELAAKGSRVRRYGPRKIPESASVRNASSAESTEGSAREIAVVT